MALNKFMHPRNIYKTPPDFTKLSETYKEFADVAKKDVSGKVCIDFKNPHALRILTMCLLKSDFNLDVVIPEDRLVPTLPLRLNYILWIEDIINIAIKKDDKILGLDIGTGACAVYPLLAAVKNKWQMVGTETDFDSLKQAKENVNRNNLQHLIDVRQNTTKSVIENIFMDDDAPAYDFCMCNPPFYTSLQDLWESRSPARPEPKNGFTGSPHELITEGGELQFCRQIIEESKKLQNKILIFTTMVGHKYNLKELVMDLKADGIKHTTTEFCQGRVTRWGLAWTYQDYDFSKIFSPRDNPQKKSTPLKFVLPSLSSFPDSVDKLKKTLQNLQITYKVIIKRKNDITLDVLAFSNTWSNQRRKRRMLKHLTNGQAKIPKPNEETSSTDLTLSEITLDKHSALNQIIEHTYETTSGNTSDNVMRNSDAEHSQAKIATPSEDTTSYKPTEISLGKSSALNKIIEPAHESTSGNTSDSKKNCNAESLVHGLMKLVNKDKLLNIEVEFLNGSAGKEGLHQIVQYIKNNWK